MKCVKCKSRLTCYETKAVEDQIVKRRYKCPKCLEKIHTIETLFTAQETAPKQPTQPIQHSRPARHYIEDMKMIDDLDDPLFDSAVDLDSLYKP